MKLKYICRKIGMECVKVGDIRKSFGTTTYKIIGKEGSYFIIKWLRNNYNDKFRPDNLWFDELISRG